MTQAGRSLYYREAVGDLPEFTSVSVWMHLEETVGVQSLVPLRTVTPSEESA